MLMAKGFKVEDLRLKLLCVGEINPGIVVLTQASHNQRKRGAQAVWRTTVMLLPFPQGKTAKG